ncbi:hypothetical protein K7432_001391 [Basidiobolus ranarum]|uniref:Uncharacterized protein n=1 Tax=Basidiobolus ranarum TaxID=34480 RepID=A0ABR2W9P2_9FUNG
MAHLLENENRRASKVEVFNTDTIKSSLNKKTQKPLQDKTQVQNITGTLSKKLQTKSKSIKLPKSFHKSPLRIKALKHTSPKKLTPITSKSLQACENVEGEKENINPATPSKTMRVKKKINEKSVREAYYKDVIHNISTEMAQITSIFETIKDDPSLKAYQDRLQVVVRGIEDELHRYIHSQVKRDKNSKEVDQESIRIQELQESIAQLQSSYVPKSSFMEIKKELENSEATLEDHKYLLEQAVSPDSSNLEVQTIQLEEQKAAIDHLQKQISISEPFESKYIESQNEVQELQTAVTELLAENEELHNQRQQ